MKKITSFLFMILLMLASGTPYATSNEKDVVVNVINIDHSLQRNLQHDCLVQTDAEKILGQPAQLTESVTEEKGAAVRHKCTYVATHSDPKTSKLGNVYYLFEQYADDASAHKAYAEILLGNVGMSGLVKLDAMGDEALWHSDENNFHLIMFRKQSKIVRIKVNKVTSLTSASELKSVMKEIALNI